MESLNVEDQRKNHLKGGILPLLGLAFKFAAKQAVKQGVKHLAKKGIKKAVQQTAKRVVKREVKNTVKDQVRNQPEQGEAPEAPAPAPAPQSPADVFYCRTRARQGISDPKCGTGKAHGKKKAKKSGKPKYDVI
jgi:hypothetical protein